MMNAVLAVLVIWSLPFFGASCGSARIDSSQPSNAQQAPTPPQETVTLTTEHPTGSFPFKSNLINDPPEILQVSVTKVVNPKASPISIFVYISPSAEKNKPEPERISVGNFSLYPADRPGKFMLSPDAAWQKLVEKRAALLSQELRLVFEMQLPEQKPAPSVEVTIASPNWAGKKKV